MKKWCLFLSLYFTVCLLAACGGLTGAPEPGEAVPPPTEELPAQEKLFRVVSGTTFADALLAQADGRDVCTLGTVTVEPTLDGASTAAMDLTLTPGTLVAVTYTSVAESWPARLQGVTAVDLRSQGFNDLCRLYLEVLEDLWTVDGGLNENGMELIGVDLSKTSLSESEKEAVAWAFASRHGCQLVTGTLEELEAQGLLTTGAEVPGAPASWREWENGCFFAIEEREDVTWSTPAYYELNGLEPPVLMGFDAWKWRSSLGAYWFHDCTAMAVEGAWGDYSVGGEMIS